MEQPECTYRGAPHEEDGRGACFGRGLSPAQLLGKMWIHASNSCKLAAAASMLKRDLEAAMADTLWDISVMQRMQPAVWTLENVPGLHQFFKGKFATCYIFDANMMLTSIHVVENQGGVC